MKEKKTNIAKFLFEYKYGVKIQVARNFLKCITIGKLKCG